MTVPKYEVEVIIHNKKTLTIYAKDEDDAEDKAQDLICSWNNVEDCEVINVSEA